MIQWILSSSLLILVLIGLRYLLRGRIKPIFQYALWALALVRLLLPIQFGAAPISVENTVENAPLLQEMELAEKVECFDYHLDGFATGYYTFSPDLEPDTDSVVNDQPVTELFTHAEADRLTQLRTAKEHLRSLWVGGMAVMSLAFLTSNLVFALRLRKTRKLVKTGKLPVYVSAAVETPCLFGLFRPKIYLTPALAEQEVSYAEAHEMTHYRHGDFLWSVLRCVCLVIHWYNPLVWWAAILSRADSEIACDEATIANLGENHRTDYGRVLINLTCRKTTDLLRTATTMTGSAKGLKERIKMIAKKPKMAIYTLIAVILVATITVGCTFTGAGETKAPTTEPTETTQPTETTKPDKVEEKLPDTIIGTPLTEEELAYFTELFTKGQDGERNWYRILLACEFSRPVDINPKRLFQNGFFPYPELTDADKAFVRAQSWYMEGPDVLKLPRSSMEEILKAYLGVSLSQINQHYLENMHYFAQGDCYFGGGGGAIGASRDTKMIDGKREEDGTIWLMSRRGSKNKTDELRIVCLKPQPDNAIAPYRVESCQWLVYLGSPYPKTGNPDDFVVFMYTGQPISVNGVTINGKMEEDCLYVYNTETGDAQKVGYGPIYNFTVGDGYIYFIEQNQMQILRCDFNGYEIGENQQVVYASGNQITGVRYGANKLFVDELGGITVWYDLTTGERQYLPSGGSMNVGIEPNSKYFLLRYLPGGEIMDGGYDGKDYTTDGMQMDYLYAVDDGVTYSISGGVVGRMTWAKDSVYDYVYFVRKDDPQKIWRTDLHGQNPTVVYESQNGDITFLAAYPGWLAIVENGNCAVLYNLAGGIRTEVLKAYKIEQFSFDAAYMYVYWRGQLNKSETDVPIEGNGYYYYLGRNEYIKLEMGTSGTPITPEQ